jgi:hypothetical protein
METTKNTKVESVDMKLEVMVLGVSDVDRAKAFYENLGWRLDIDVAAGDFRGVQMTPHNSEASIIFGKGITSAKRGSADSLVLAVDDLDAARRTSLVGLVRTLPDGTSERPEPGGGRSSSRPVYGGGPPCSSPMTPFEWPHSPSTNSALRT